MCVSDTERLRQRQRDLGGNSYGKQEPPLATASIWVGADGAQTRPARPEAALGSSVS